MTIIEARKALSGPLKFGDPAQVAAHAFLVAAEECADALEKCDCDGGGECETCDGDGECPHCGGECPKCEGSGHGACACIEDVRPDIAYAAETVTAERKKAKEEAERCAANLS